MDDKKLDLKGSKNRDLWKWWHKQLNKLQKGLYGLDLDFICVSKYPARIIAALDYKMPGDSISFAEVIAYNDLLSKDIPVYLIEGLPPFDKLTIKEYLGGDHRPDPPTCEIQTLHSDLSPSQYIQWELGIRNKGKTSHDRT